MSIKCKKVLQIVLIILYICIGSFVCLVAFGREFLELPKDYALYGLLICLSSLVHFVLYFYYQGYKNPDKSFYLVLALLALSIGFIIMFQKGEGGSWPSLSVACLIWGILDIVRGSFQIKDSIPELKENKLAYIEMVLSIGDVIVGILLCIFLKNGINFHLIYLGISYLVTAAKIIIEKCCFKDIK